MNGRREQKQEKQKGNISHKRQLLNGERDERYKVNKIKME
jgi:hypothetical protein